MTQNKEPRKIDRDTYLKGLALYTMSNQLYVQCREMQLKMEEMLGTEDGSHLSDAVYSSSIGRVADFDEALSRENITIEGDV